MRKQNDFSQTDTNNITRKPNYNKSGKKKKEKKRLDLKSLNMRIP